MNKLLKIIFSNKTSSKNLKEALRLASKLQAIVEDDLLTIELTTLEVFNLWENVNALLNIIDKWKSFEIYYKGRLCVINKDYRMLFYAMQEIRQCYAHNQNDPIDYEKCNSGWGCNKLKNISLKLTGIERKWFEYGYFKGPNNWSIDKNKILNEIEVEISQKYLNVCPAFPMKRIKNIIDNLEVDLKIGVEWLLDMKTEVVDGTLTKIPVIRYNEEFEEYCNYVDKETSSIAIKVNSPFPVGSDEWLDWMNAKRQFNKNRNNE